MMTGIEILSMTEVATEYTYNYLAAGIIYLLLIIGCGILMAFASGYWNWKNFGLGVLVGVLIGVLLFAAVCKISREPIAYETQYKVLLDESISLTDFLEKYEILGQDGKIYIIRERNPSP